MKIRANKSREDFEGIIRDMLVDKFLKELEPYDLLRIKDIIIKVVYNE